MNALLALMAAGLFRLTAPQADLLQESVARTEIACAGIRGGKTHVGAFKTILRAINEPTREDQCHAVISPTFRGAKIGPEPKLKRLFADKKIFPVSPLVQHHKTDRTFYVKNREGHLSRIRVFSGEDPDLWRGDEWLSAWLDEGAYLDAYAWTVAQGRLSSTRGVATITTTPDGYNWVYDESESATVVESRSGYELRRSPDGRVLFVRWPSMGNVLIDSRGFEELREKYDPETFAQEVEAQFVGKSGRVYKAFDRTRHVRDETFSRSARVFIGQDFNVDPMASAIVQVPVNHPDWIHVHDEICLRDADTYKLSRAVGEWCQRAGVSRKLVTFVADAAARQRKTAANSSVAKSDLEVLRRDGWDVTTEGSNPRLRDRVNCVNGLFAHNRASLSPRCSNTIAALEKQGWDLDADPVVPEKDGWHDNFADAFGYVAWKLAPLRRVTTVGGLAA